MAIYFLDNDQRLLKIVPNDGAISILQTQELPDDNSLLKDTLSVRLKNDERLFDAQYMAIKSYDGNRNSFDMYRIINELVPDNATEFEGMQVAPYELEGVIVEDMRPQNWTVERTVNQILQDSDWRLGYIERDLPSVTTNFYYLSAKDSLKKLQELLGIEITFKVEISGNKVTDKWIEAYKQLGNRTLKRFNYGTNALTVKRETSSTELYTALIGRGKGEEVGETDAGDATYGRKITFEDIEWSKANGDPVDKPKGQKYIELPEATTEFGIKLLDGRKVPRIGIVEFPDTEEPEVLIKETWQALQSYARPKVLFSAVVANIGDTGIGDTVTIHRHDLNMHYEPRVRKVMRNRKNNNKTQVEIGDVVYTPSTKRQANINSALSNMQDELGGMRGEVTYARRSADGKNTNFYGNEEPERKRVGDTWYRDHPSLVGERQILIWNGEAWVLEVDTSETTKNADAIAQQQQELEEAKQTAKEDTDQALADAKAYADAEDERIKNELGASIDEALNTAEDAKQDAIDRANQALEDAKTYADEEVAKNKEEFDAIFGDMEIEIEQAQSTADQAVNLINGEIANKFTDIDVEIAQVHQDAQAALNQAGDAVSQVAYFGETIDGFTQTVANIDGRVTNIRQDVDGIVGTITDHTGKIASIEFNVNGLQGIISDPVNGLSTQVSALASGFNVLASDFENLEYENRNLIVASEVTPRTYVQANGTVSTTTGAFLTDFIEVKAGQAYTISMVLEGNGFSRVAYYDSEKNFLKRDLLQNQKEIYIKPDKDGFIRWSPDAEGSDYKPGFKFEKGTKATPWSPAPEDMATQAQLSVLSDNINMRVVQKNEVIAQINLSPEGILIDGKRTHITGQTVIDNGVIRNAHIYDLHADKITAGTIKTARLNATEIVAQGLVANVVKSVHIETSTALVDKIFANDAMVNRLTAKQAFISSIQAIEISATKITSGTINTARLNAADIVTKGLTANVVKSTHIETSTALVDKIFANTAQIDRLVGKTAFINGIKAIEISADKITTGTLFGNNVTAVGINVNTIVGNTSEFVRSAWNSATGGTVYIDGGGISSTASDGSQVYIQNGITGVRNPQGNSLGHIGYNRTTDRAFYNIETSLGTNFSISARLGTSGNTTRYTMMDIFPGSSETYIRTNDFRHVGASGGVSGPTRAFFDGEVRIGGEITATSSNMSIQQMNFRYGSWLYDQSTNSDLMVVGGGRLRFFTRGASSAGSLEAFRADNTHVYMYRTLSMEGNNITNQSDERLKFNIQETHVDSLEEIKSMRFVEFDRTNGNHDDIGVIAQSTPSLALYDAESDVWSINSSKQIMMTTHAVQQLAFSHEETKTLALSNEEKIHQLQKELSKANRKIEELEGKIA